MARSESTKWRTKKDKKLNHFSFFLANNAIYLYIGTVEKTTEDINYV